MIDDAAVTAFQKLADVAQYRSDVYRLLALGFSNPTSDFVTDLQNGALVDNLRRCLDAVGLSQTHYGSALVGLTGIAAEYRTYDPRTLLTQLRVEYMRLFVGPKNPVTPIYETLHREQSGNGQAMLIVSQTALAVEKAYHEAGVHLTSHDSPDHLATELEFLVYLCEKEAIAWETANNTMAKKWRRIERDFLDDHLGTWSLVLCRQAREATNEPFYREFVTLAETFLTMETGAFQPRH